jgi:hypothetical protein
MTGLRFYEDRKRLQTNFPFKQTYVFSTTFKSFLLRLWCIVIYMIERESDKDTIQIFCQSRILTSVSKRKSKCSTAKVSRQMLKINLCVLLRPDSAYPSRYSTVGVATLRAGRSWVPIPAVPSGVSIIQILQTDSGAHPPSYAMSTEVPTRDRAAGAWCWPLNSLHNIHNILSPASSP